MDANFSPDTFYHVYNHAIGNENLFRKQDNYLYFLKKYAQYIEPVCGMYAYCLLPNHFHLLLKVRNEAELLDFYLRKHSLELNPAKLEQLEHAPQTIDLHKLVMQEFQNWLDGYTKAFNKMFKRKGGLFLHFLKRKEITSSAYLQKVAHYIHYNPVHHGFCQEVLDWEFSSIHAFLAEKKSNVEREGVLQWFNNEQSFWAFHQLMPEETMIGEMEFF